MTASQSPEQIEVRLVLEAIYAKYGYDLREYAIESIHRRVLTAMSRAGAAHLGDFIHKLLTEPEVFLLALDDLTVQVSEMFRDPEVYQVFRERIVPLLRTYPQLKIWHAGCANGEEVYTTAILLAEEGLYERSQIYATDLSASAVERAREGMYPETQASEFARNYRLAGGKASFDEYFTRAYGRIAVKDALRKNVVFFQHDLVTDHAPGEMHVVFCRNVLIYFGARIRARAVGLFRESLCHGGFLCLGASEALTSPAATSFAAFAANARIYQKREQT